MMHRKMKAAKLGMFDDVLTSPEHLILLTFTNDYDDLVGVLLTGHSLQSRYLLQFKRRFNVPQDQMESMLMERLV